MSKQEEFDNLTVELLKHRYRYYHLDNPTISDYDYDMMERKWTALGDEVGVDWATYPNWVGWDPKHPLADRALEGMGVLTFGMIEAAVKKAAQQGHKTEVKLVSPEEWDENQRSE